MVTPSEACRRSALSTSIALGLLTWSATAAAQALRIQPEVEAIVTVTNNANAAPAAEARSDAIVSVSPRLHVWSRGARSSLEGTLGFEAVTYLNGTEDSIVRPRGSLLSRNELAERLLFLNASVTAAQISASPYSSRPDAATAFNDYTQMRYRLTPYVERQLNPALKFYASTDYVFTRRAGSSSALDPAGTTPLRDTNEEQQIVRLEQTPTPFGLTAELSRDSSRLADSDIATLTQRAARLVVNYALDAQVTVGLVAGRETSEYSTINRRDSIGGVRLNWRPNERGDLRASIESRYFGVGGDLEWRQRSPYFGFALRASRQPVAQSGSHLLGAAGDSVSSLLDGVLTTRYPDAGQRTTVVNDLIRRLNLPSTLLGPIEFYGSYAQLQSNASATAFFFGRLTTASVTVFALRRVRLVDLEDVLAPASLDSDNQQIGTEIELTRRLSTVLSLDGGLRYSRIEGLGVTAGQASRDVGGRVGFTLLLTPSTRFSAGLRYQNVRSTVAGASNETALVASLLHRF